MSQERSSAQMNEQEIQFKKRARRRLVGAVALVLLMVTVLPMVLDDRAAKAPQQEIAITIPSQDGSEFTSKIVPVSPENKTSATPLAETSVVAKPDLTPPPKVAEPKPESNKPAEAPVTQAAELPAPPIPADKALTKGESASAGPAKSPPVNNKVLEKNTIEPNPNKSNGLAVQIGVFSDAANVKQLQQKLQSQGYKSYTEKLSTSKGEKIRLRAGPFATRAEAESALAKIKDSGLSGMIVSNK